MSRDDILTQLKAGKMTVEEAAVLLAQQMTVKSGGKLFCKVSRKGAISLYGLQQMPVTLYAQQWERLLQGAPQDHVVLAFIKEWEGKEYKSEAALERGGKKVPYVAKITRKAA